MNCPLPYPAEDPAPRDVVLAHCRTCWWYEWGRCYNAHPDNPRYPHRFGRTPKHIPLAENPGSEIDAGMLHACSVDRWRWFNPRASASLEELPPVQCNDEPITPTIPVSLDEDCTTRWRDDDDVE